MAAAAVPPEIAVLADVNMAKIYVALEVKMTAAGRADEVRQVNSMHRGGVAKFGAALNAILGGGFEDPQARIRFYGCNGVTLGHLTAAEYEAINEVLEKDMWYTSRRDAGQIYAAALALDTLTEEEQEVLKIQTAVIDPALQTRFQSATTNAFEMQTSDKLLVASNAVLRAAGLEALRAEESHFRGRNGYVFHLHVDDPRRQYLAGQIGATETVQAGLQLVEDVPQRPPPEPICTNETCIICVDGMIRSAMNPEGCRHAFCCDQCVERLSRCAMCQAPKMGSGRFGALVPPISEEHPVYHAIMGNVTTFTASG